MTAMHGDRKWADGVEYEFLDHVGQWCATGRHEPGLAKAPRSGELKEMWDRYRHDACIVDAKAGEPPWDMDEALNAPKRERKAQPIYSGVVRYFPDALAELAALSLAGNEQHNSGEPLHWARSKSTDELDALCRHMAEAGTLDDDGFYHDVKVAWRGLANLQKLLERVRGLPMSPGSRP